jgi:hypothetical protein
MDMIEVWFKYDLTNSTISSTVLSLISQGMSKFPILSSSKKGDGTPPGTRSISGGYKDKQQEV